LFSCLKVELAAEACLRRCLRTGEGGGDDRRVDTLGSLALRPIGADRLIWAVCDQLDHVYVTSFSEEEQLCAIRAARGCLRLSPRILQLRLAVLHAIPLMLVRLQRLRGALTGQPGHGSGPLSPLVASEAGRAIHQLGHQAPRAQLCWLLAAWSSCGAVSKAASSSSAPATPRIPDAVRSEIKAAADSIDADAVGGLTAAVRRPCSSAEALSAWRIVLRQGLAVDAAKPDRLLDGLVEALVGSGTRQSGPPAGDVTLAAPPLRTPRAALEAKSECLPVGQISVQDPVPASPTGMGVGGARCGDSEAAGADLGAAARSALWSVLVAISPPASLQRKLDEWVDGYAADATGLETSVRAWRDRALCLLRWSASGRMNLEVICSTPAQRITLLIFRMCFKVGDHAVRKKDKK